jgi:hypothetical protein
MSQASKPETVDDLTADELDALEALGRIENGKVLDAPKADTATAAPIPKNLVPEMPAGVKERLEAAAKLQSSFVTTDTTGTTKTASADGGAAAEAAAEKAELEANPDWVGKPKEDPIEHADKMQFLAHLMGARFTKSYMLFGGAVKVTYQTRTGAEESICQDQSWADEKRIGSGAPMTMEAVEQRFGRYGSYRIVGALTEIRFGEDVPKRFKPFDEKAVPEAHLTSIGVAYQNLMELPQSLLVTVMKQGVKFESLVARLTIAADTPDFWKADSGS